MTKKILITGGAGYIGSHICENLIKNKKKIFVIDNLSTGHKKLLNTKVKFYKVTFANESDARNNLRGEEKELKFDDFLSKESIENITRTHAGRGGGVGIKSFTWKQHLKNVRFIFCELILTRTYVR